VPPGCEARAAKIRDPAGTALIRKKEKLKKFWRLQPGKIPPGRN
jgi:hypothetical protein